MPGHVEEQRHRREGPKSLCGTSDSSGAMLSVVWASKALAKGMSVRNGGRQDGFSGIRCYSWIVSD